MRVLYCTDTYPPQVNGVSVVTAASVEGLSRRGWECGVVAPRYPDDAESPFDRDGPVARAVRLALPSVAMPTYPDVRLAAPLYLRVLRAALGVPEDALLFAHVGRLAHEKNVGVLVDAFRSLCDRLPARRLHLVIAGTGPCERALRDRATANVQFLGHLDRRAVLPALYASSDAFLFSSLTETLGLVVLEAMASGLPVVAAPAGGVADHLRHGVNGLAVPAGPPAAMAFAMAAQLERLVSDGALRRRLATGARATAERLGWSAELDRLDASYREVVLTGGDGIGAGGPPR